MVFQNWHGTTVAGFAAGQTTEAGKVQPQDADYAAIGFNNKIIPFKKNDPLGRALYASTVMHADVISYSSIGTCDMTESAKLQAKSIIQEILDNGTVIVAAAGNGFCAGCYKNTSGIIDHISGCEDPGDFVEFTPPYPFSPLIDSRIISVTGVTKGDSLTRRVYNPITQQYTSSTWSYFDQIDVCAPGYDLWGLQTTLIRVIDTLPLFDTVADQFYVYYDTTYIKRDHPYWNGYGGTSFATPIVAGLASLIKAHAPWLSAAQVEDIIIKSTDLVQDRNLYYNHNTHKSRTGSGRINAFKALRKVENFANNYRICDKSEVIWNEPVFVKDTIWICTGSTLKVKSDVFFRPSGRVIVECGGKLIVDAGGRLTGTGNHLWKGVLAYSDSDGSQNSVEQSTVIVQDGGIIEDAEIGIESVLAGHSSDNVMTEGGAIIIGIYGVFRNNITSVKLNPYKSPSSSLFVECQFLNDRCELRYRDTLDSFIHLNKVNGVKFYGCTFNNMSCPTVGRGIYSYNSSYRVGDHCNGSIPCPKSGITPSSFSNLRYGIYSIGASGLTSPIIQNTIFENNRTATYISGIYGLKFNNNTIKVYQDSTNIKNSHYCGLYLDASTGYDVSENTFYLPTGFQADLNAIGIIVNNSGPENNIIYLNSFTNLTHGIHAQGENRSRDGYTGLEIKCNTFSNCNTDISVYAVNSGIKENQGSLGSLPTDAAGNHFSNLTKPGYWSIYNDALWINYNYHKCGLLSKLYPTKVFQVNRNMSEVEYSSASCPSSAGGKETKEELVSLINENKSHADSLSNELTMLVDLNNTPLVVSDIITSMPEDSTNIFNELVEISPYVSDTVIFESIKKEDVFSNKKIFDLIRMNAHASKSNKIIDEIDNRQSYMPDSMYYSIISFADSVSGMQIFESSISSRLRDASWNFYKYYHRNLDEDSISQGFIDTLNIINLFEAKALKAAYFFNSNKFDSAYSDLELLYNSDLITGYENKCEDLLKFYTICSKYGLDNIPDSVLLSLYDTTTNQSTAFYRNLLINRGLIDYQEPYLFSSQMVKSGKVRRTNVESNTHNQESTLRVYPNPAKDYLVIEFIEPDKVENVSVRIIDIFGKVISSCSLNKILVKSIIKLDTFSPGIYLIEVITEGSKKEAIKFTVIK